jgi:hypothetical protein
MFGHLLEFTRRHGNSDAVHSGAQIMRKGDKFNMWVYQPTVESLLYCCNLMNEGDKFHHPDGLTFDQFLRKLELRGWKFNKTYNYLEQKKEEYKWSKKFGKEK